MNSIGLPVITIKDLNSQSSATYLPGVPTKLDNEVLYTAAGKISGKWARVKIFHYCRPYG